MLCPWCHVHEHRALIWPQESNIDRKINKCWLRVVFRNVRFDLRVSLSPTVDIDRFRELWTGILRYSLWYIFSFSWSHILFNFQPCVWIYDLSLSNACFDKYVTGNCYQIVPLSIHGYVNVILTRRVLDSSIRKGFRASNIRIKKKWHWQRQSTWFYKTRKSMQNPVQLYRRQNKSGRVEGWSKYTTPGSSSMSSEDVIYIYILDVRKRIPWRPRDST